MDEMRLAFAYDRQVERPQTGQILKTSSFPGMMSAVRENLPFSTEDVKTDPIFSELLMDYWMLHEVRSAMAVPLEWDDAIRAVVFFEQPEKGRVPFDAETPFALAIKIAEGAEETL